MNWKRYLLTLSGITLVLLTIGVTINLTVDIQGIYSNAGGSAYYDRYVHNLMSSRFGLVMAHYDRSIKLRLAELSDADCYVTGSSREMPIDLSTLPILAAKCAKILNLAVPQGGYEDLIAAAGKVAANPHARHLFIGIQAWSFRTQASDWWTQESEAYANARRLFGMGDGATVAPRQAETKLRNLVNGAYLLSNLKTLWRIVSTKGSAFPPIVAIAKDGEAPNDSDEILLPNGRVIYSRQALVKSPPSPTPPGDGSDFLSPTVSAFAPLVAAQYEHIVDQLKQRDITVHYIVLPYHPKILECAKQWVCDVLTAVETGVRTMARRQGNEVIGSFDPRQLGMDWRDFMDNKHLVPAALPKAAVVLP